MVSERPVCFPFRRVFPNDLGHQISGVVRGPPHPHPIIFLLVSPFLSHFGQPAGMMVEDGGPFVPFQNRILFSWLTHLPRIPEKDEEVDTKGKKGPGWAGERK